MESTATASSSMDEPRDGPGRRSGRGDRLVPLLCLLGAGSLIGVSTDLAKAASDAGLAPLPFLTWSVVGAAGVLVAVAARRHRLPTINKQTIEYFTVAALVSLAAPQLILFSAVPRVGASFVALAIAFPPLYTYLGALLLRMERFDCARALGVGLALAASVLLAALKLAEPDAQTVWIVLTLSAPILLAAGNLYRTRRWPTGASPDELAPGMVVAAAVMLVVVGLLPGVSLTVPVTDTASIGLIVAQALTFSGLYLLFFVLQARGGPVYLSLLGSVGAVVGSAIAITVLGETAPRGLLPAGLLIAIGIALVTRDGVNGAPARPTDQPTRSNQP